MHDCRNWFPRCPLVMVLDMAGNSKTSITSTMSLVMSLVATAPSLLVGVLVYQLDLRQDTAETLHTTLQEIRIHRLRMSELDTVFVCTNALLSFPEKVAKSVRRLRSSRIQFGCDRDWCWQYRRCIGANIISVPDGVLMRIDEDAAWRIGRTVREAIASYETLATLACSGAIDKWQVLSLFEKQLYIKSAPVRYIERFYSRESALDKLPGIAGALGNLYPEQFPEWADTCPLPRRIGRRR